MTFFSRVEAIGEKIKETATELLTKIFGAANVQAFEKQVETIFQQDVIVIFQDAVTAAESLQLGGVAATGAQKRDAAFSQIAKDLETKGLSLGTSVINLGIEMVVNLLQSKAPSAS